MPRLLRLLLALSGTAVSGKETTVIASGQQTDVDTYNHGGNYSAFTLEVFVKDPSVDPTCAPDFIGEQQARRNDPSERQVVIGQGQGAAQTFSVPIKIVFPGTGPVLFCGYSSFINDTAASATLTINVTGDDTTPTPTTTPTPATTPTPTRRATATCKAELKKKGKKKFQAK